MVQKGSFYNFSRTKEWGGSVEEKGRRSVFLLEEERVFAMGEISLKREASNSHDK